MTSKTEFTDFSDDEEVLAAARGSDRGELREVNRLVSEKATAGEAAAVRTWLPAAAISRLVSVRLPRFLLPSRSGPVKNHRVRVKSLVRDRTSSG
jgi:hypothetical protein